MTIQSATLISSNPSWSGIPWKTTDRRVQCCTLKQIFGASTSESFPAMPVERIVIEGTVESTEFLVLLATLHPTFTGDVLFIDRPDRAFLSATSAAGSRILYTLSSTDIDFYVDVNGLREEVEQTAWRMVADSQGNKLAARPLRVLIAEEDPRSIKSVTSILSGVGCETLVAHSGFEAVRLVERSRPDVLLLDGLGPEIQGFEVARFVKSIDSDYQPRTIIVSPSEGKPEAGVDGYLVKPVGFDQIASAIF